MTPPEVKGTAVDGTDQSAWVSFGANSDPLLPTDVDFEIGVDVPPLPPGSLVPEFADNGVLAVIGGEVSGIVDIAADSSALYILIGGWQIQKLDLSDGTPVAAFGAGGVVTSARSARIAVALAVDSVAMYVLGTEQDIIDREPPRWRIEKRNLSDGSLVPAFGTGGVLSWSINGGNKPSAIVVDSTNIYVAGPDPVTPFSIDWQWRIEKRDKSTGDFGAGGGVILNNPSPNHERPVALAVDSTALYVIGTDRTTGVDQGRIEKRDLITLALVPGFGSRGVIVSNENAHRWIAVDSTGLYVAGTLSDRGIARWRVEKRDIADGTMDGQFGTGGVIMSPAGQLRKLGDLALDSTALYLVGNDPGFRGQWRTEKRSFDDGTLVATFGTGGIVLSPDTSPSVGGPQIALSADSIYVGGTIDRPDPPGGFGPLPPDIMERRIERRYK